MPLGFLLVAGLVFSIALAGAAFYLWRLPQQDAERAIAGRLRELRARSGSKTRTDGDLMRKEQEGTFSFLAEFFTWIGGVRRVQGFIDQANLRYRAIDVVVVSIALALGMYLLLGLFGLSMFLLRVVLALLFGGIPLGYILWVRGRRLAKFQDTFPDAIDLFNRSMKAGHTITSGLETVASEMGDPVRMEFKKVIEELNLGAPLDNALLGLTKRVPLIDLKFFVTTLLLQRQTGANMIDVLDNLSLLVRERINMAAKMKAHTAQQRLTASLLCALPVVFAVGTYIVEPARLNVLFDTSTGNTLLTYAIVSEIIGILIIRKIASPRF